MIKQLVLKNFKSIRNQVFDFTDFDLLVGRNNSGKSTILQALAIWQYCIGEFRRSERKGNNGIQVVLPNFTALPLPEFNLLWTDRIDREYNKIDDSDKKKQTYIYVEIGLKWQDINGEIQQFGVKIRYQTPQSAYAIPIEGWQSFKKLDEAHLLPNIVYVPPFSGLEPNEEWRDDGIIKRQVGKAQPGSVLRNLLFRVFDKKKPQEKNDDWEEIVSKVKAWFGVKLLAPQYVKGVSTEIKCAYEASKEFDIISGGSGFHQTLTLLAFFYGYEGLSTILFDEPDAHLHVNLQREVLNYFKQKQSIQFLIATHSEEFISGVSASNIMSVLKSVPERIQSTQEIVVALSDISNMAIVQTQQSPFILYVEGEDDERLLSTWATVLNKQNILSNFYVEKMGGTTKKDMKEKADRHFNGLQKIVTPVKRLIIFDFDTEETAFHPLENNPSLFEWKRKNIENYLLVPDTWKRALRKKLNGTAPAFEALVDDFFEGQNLTLPRGKTWENVDANIFEEVNGKRILFENANSLFHKIQNAFHLEINRETLAENMIESEVHIDVKKLFSKLESLTKK